MHPNHRNQWAQFFATLLLLGILAVPQPVQAAGIRAVVNKAQQNSGKTVTFLLGAASTARIDRVELVYGITSSSCLGTRGYEKMDLQPGLQVNASYEWDLGIGDDFLPGLEIWWQWEISDADGNDLTTDKQYLILEDPEYKWQRLEKEPIALYWTEGKLDFGKRMMDIAERTTVRLAEKAGVLAPDSIRIVVYPDVEKMLEVVTGVPDWTGGVAYPDYNLVILGIPPGAPYQWPADVISHELAHVIMKMGANSCLKRKLPLWLEEGLADYAGGKLTNDERERLMRALDEEKLPALNTLVKKFPGDGDDAELAYEHSQAVVEYMLDNLGAEKLDRLLASLRKGQPVDDALRPIYGFDTDGLDQAWRANEGFGVAPELTYVTFTPSPTITRTPTPDLSTATPTPSVPPTQTRPAPTLTPSATLVPATPTPTPPASQIPDALLFFPALLFVGLIGGASFAAARYLRIRQHPPDPNNE